jgi:hypothetical protein
VLYFARFAVQSPVFPRPVSVPFIVNVIAVDRSLERTRLPRSLECASNFGAVLLKDDSLFGGSGIARYVHSPSTGDVRRLILRHRNAAAKQKQRANANHKILDVIILYANLPEFLGFLLLRLLRAARMNR